MPQAIGFFLFSGPLGAIFSFGTLVTAANIGLVVAGSLASELLRGALANKPETPKPEDGKYNLRQNVPSLPLVLGRVEKGGDYALLEETGGLAYHVLVHAGHSIQGYVQHKLHDDVVTIDGSGIVTAPSNFVRVEPTVRIFARTGADAETAYAPLVAAMPSIWTSAHRGDGLASVMMSVRSVSAEAHQKTYPNGMPAHRAVLDGNDRIYDPRTSAVGYTTNLALFRLWHLTHPVGGKLTLDDMHLPDWSNAANVADQNVTNRQGGTTKRYHGGMWFRAENDPRDVGRIMDEAAEMVVYETRDGKIGVHAGQFVEPDIRLTEKDILRRSFDVNRRRSSNVLAVRGRFTDPAMGYNTVDAAIYGNPYAGDDTQRTRTVENVAVQAHNHMARLQKIKFIRANAPLVRITATYESAREVRFRRFVRVHMPPQLVESVIEIVGRPKLSLRNLTVEFEGIVVPAGTYDFDAATEEGEPGGSIVILERQAIPVPQGFDVLITAETVSGGSTAAFGLASWGTQVSSLITELTWQPTAGGAISSVTSQAGETSLRSNYLADGVEYRFRARNWSGGAYSEWTDYEIRTATADPTAPAIVTGASASGGAGQVSFAWTAPNSANYFASRLYLNTSNTFAGATLVAVEYGAPATADSRVVSGVPVGTYFGFVEAINASGVPAAAAGTGSVTVT